MINKFSRLHQRETLLEESLKTKQVCAQVYLQHDILMHLETDDKQKDKEDLEEISSELELADEDEKVPYVVTSAPKIDISNMASQLQDRRFVHALTTPGSPDNA